MPPQPLRLAFAPQTDPAEIRVRIAAGPHQLGTARFTCRTGQRLTPTADALLCLGLYPASETGTALEIDGAVDAGLLSRAATITGMFRDWWPGCRSVPVSAQRAAPRTAPPADGTAAFYSGGIDSSFTLADALPRLTAIVTLLGVDVPLSDQEGCARMEAMCRDVAARLGIEAVVIETDIRQKFHRHASWIEFHGSALAAIGHLLSGRIGRILIAASGDEKAWGAPWGSHPGLDPLFGSAALTIEHHGLVARVDKIARIAPNDALMHHLRVCNVARHNCGVCDKCTFAMRALAILGASGRAPTFPPAVPGQGRFKITDDAFLSEMEKLRARAEEASDATTFLPEIDRAIAVYRRKRLWRRGFGLESLPARLRVAKHRWRWHKDSP
ncbi:hypothetical protein SAMN05878503_107110 [Cereibacter ovatus]|uniref:7-cyano-7-deazaguanine synthase in queuosine biosynthesis n=1 Tax=Cereibacter ovatus TaxID=439529 RepID=A0A285CUA9_9RHOB|nr:hypothetical protein [Cereibacter ovatus]SNX70995.1 hypothetical protein SAMN05878503_107110 [Cereibacter ovatus]